MNKNSQTTIIRNLTLLALIGVNSIASAQEPVPPAAPAVAPAPPPPAAPPPPPAPPPAQPVAMETQVGVAATSAGPTAANEGAAEQSDHEQVVGHVGVGYLGRRSMLLGQLEFDPTSGGIIDATPLEVTAPVIGIRYWVNSQVGIDAGLGFFTNGGKVKGTSGEESEETDLPGITAFMFHAGVPVSLASARHFSFQIVPEANVGFASQTIEDVVSLDGGTTMEDLDNKGFHLDIGVRAGAEIHFGFIGIPKLSLQGSVGVQFAYDKVSSELAEAKLETSIRQLGTSVGDNPWNIFTSNVAALYYF